MRRAATDRGALAVDRVTRRALAALALVAAIAPCAPAGAATRAAPESLVAETATTRLYRLTLRSPSGRAVRAMLRVPRDPRATRACGVVLAGGFRNGWRAAEFLDPGPEFALLSVDFPYEGRRSRIPAGDFIGRAPEFWRATHEMSDLLLQAGDLLARRPGVDSTRLAIVGGSLGVPFALHAAARSPRFRAVAVLYGSAGLDEWIARNIRGAPRWVAILAGRLVAALYPDYEPARLIPRIRPRPVLLVNGRGDPRISEAGALRLFEAAGEPREQVWIESGAHIKLENEALLRRLIDVTLEWLRRIGFARAGAAAEDPAARANVVKGAAAR